MDNSSLSIEEKVQQATRMPDPNPDFANELWGQIKVHQQRPPLWKFRIQNLLMRPMIIMVSIFLVLGVAVVLIGPQRVFASLRKVLGYIPGVGFVNIESAVALQGPVELTQNGQTFLIEQLLSSAKEMVLVVRIKGFPAYQYVGLDSGISVKTTNGDVFIPHSFSVNVTEIPGEYLGIFKFQPLTSGTTQAIVSWKQPSTKQIPEPVTWQIPVTLSQVSDPGTAKQFPGSYTPDHASASHDGITLEVDQITSSSTNLSVRLQRIFPKVFNWVQYDTLNLIDDSGATYQNRIGQVHFEDNGQSPEIVSTTLPTLNVFKKLHETLTFPAINPAVKQLTLHVGNLKFSASPFIDVSVDLGSQPAVGDSWPVNQIISIGDLSLRVNTARLVSLDKDAPGSRGLPMLGVVLGIEPVNPGQVQVDQIELRVWGAQRVYDQNTTTWSPAWSADQLPTGMVDIHIDNIQGTLFGDWDITWQNRTP